MALQPLFDALSVLINTPNALSTPVKAQTQAFIDSEVEDFSSAATSIAAIVALPSFTACSPAAKQELRKALHVLSNA